MPKIASVDTETLAKHAADLAKQLAETKAALRKATRQQVLKKPTAKHMADARLLYAHQQDASLVKKWFLHCSITDSGILDTAVLAVTAPEVGDATPASAAAAPHLEGESPTPLPRRLARFCQEHRLHQWVEEQNLTKGLAPAAHHAWAQHVVHDPSATARTRLKKSRHQWLRRWRRRWSVQLGSINIRETVATSEAQLKVMRLYPRQPTGW